MKTQYLLPTITSLIITLISACIPGAGDSPVRIELTDGPGFISTNTTARADSMLTFSIHAVPSIGLDFGGTLKSISASYSTNGKSAVTILDSTLSISFSGKMIIKHRLVGNVADVVKYTFVVTEANGPKDTTSVEIQISPVPAPLKVITDQIVHNALYYFYAPESAYDLNTAKGLKKDDTAIRKDLIDQTIPNSSGEGQFSKKWASGNFTRYVKVSNDDYDMSSTTTDLFNLWVLHEKYSLPVTETLSAGDIYLIKSGQNLSFNLYVLQVTAVEDVPVLGNNNDYVKFNYKKIDN